MKRMQGIAELRDSEPVETLTTLISLLDSPVEKIPRMAASLLHAFQNHVGPKVDTLVAHLQHHKKVCVRQSCVLVLMNVQPPVAAQVFAEATKDPYDGVVQLACLELGSRSGPESTAALIRVLGHPSWRVRLEACKALITLGTADQRVVSTLEEMSRDPEAGVYDAEDADMEKFEQEEFDGKPPYGARWGKLNTILAKARTIADRND